MNTHRLPIGVVIPTLNVRNRLPAHLAQITEWVDIVQEVVVVDSHSTDGTVEFIKQQLHHPQLRILQHPPGLYQSWNFGIRNVTAEYTYISTVGDSITPEGLRHLVATAAQLLSDVVISRPEFFTLEGQRLTNKRWPVHHLHEWHPLVQPMRVEPLHAFLLATLDAPEGSLGSSASNLYRTEILQRFPFPTDYGHLGDTAWGIRHAFQASLGVTPKVFSGFVIHPSGGQISDDLMDSLVSRLYTLARKTMKESIELLTPMPGIASLLQFLCDLPVELRNLRNFQARYDEARQKLWPWIFNPAAWKLRLQRNRQRGSICKGKREIREQFGLQSRLRPRDDQKHGE